MKHGEAKRGASRSSLYRRWMAMKQRCYMVSNASFKNYGGRGITVQQSWLESFENFRDWANSNGYEQTLQLDRIDTNGNYTEKNCRWISKKENSRNKRQSIFITVDGETNLLCVFAERYGVNRNMVHGRLLLGWDPKEALTTPSKPEKRTKRPLRLKNLNKLQPGLSKT
jgi:hypothetical protein